MSDRPDQEDPGERPSSYSFRRKLSEGLTGLLDPEGALGNVAGFAQGTKSELVRIFANEVRSFLDNMDSVEMLQRVVAGLVVDIHTEIRFSLDDDGKLKPTITNRDSTITGPAAAETPPAPPASAPASAPAPAPASAQPTTAANASSKPEGKAPADTKAAHPPGAADPRQRPR